MVSSTVTSEFNDRARQSAHQPLLLTRLSPPPQQARLLSRRRIDSMLAAALDYPLTLIVAPAGSGKTTALSNFMSRGGWPGGWCRLAADDDAASLLRHLTACWRPVAVIDEERIAAELARGALPVAVLELLVNELAAQLHDETLLVLEDYHLIDGQPELRFLVERLAAILPLRLHLLLSTRYEPSLQGLATAQARGELLRVGQRDLAFTNQETEALYGLYERPVPPQAEQLTAFCRGWPLALQALAQAGEGRTPDAPDNAVTPLLDAYLAQEVLLHQPLALQELLLRVSSLRWIDQQASSALPLLAPLAAGLPLLEERQLFVEQQGLRLAFQPLFAGFLARTASRQFGRQRELHLAAAAFYQANGDLEGAVHHLLEAGEGMQAAAVLEQVAPAWLREGLAGPLLALVERLPAPTAQQPGLLEIAAAALRRSGRFAESIERYAEAEAAYTAQGNGDGRVRALKGRAEVYLDTVQPAPAGALLKQALRLLPRERAAERSEILRLQAENWANSGRADVALLLQRSANLAGSEGTDDGQQAEAVPARLLLRSGQLNEARIQLEAQLLHGTALATTAHREPPLLLALLYTLLGNSARALALARRGLLEAEQGGSTITAAVAHMRVGHALQIAAPLDSAQANRHYLEALALAQDAGVARTRAEAFMGLALLHGHGGDLAAAEAATQEGIALAQASGDSWMTALLWLALGGAGVAAGVDLAPGWLHEAQQRFERGGDHYGQAMVDMWLAIWHIQHGAEPEAKEHIGRLLGAAQRFGYEGPLSGPSLFGPRDLPMLTPLLLRGRSQGEHGAYARQLLRHAFPSLAADEGTSEYHPGYTLRVQLLGTFRVWRGMREIQAREWQREKARQLLQLLLTSRGHWVQREQICAWLWPENDLEGAEKQFKVTLNALNAALEPLRPPRTEPFFIRRQGLAYSFAPSYGCWVDVDEFELRLNASSALQADQDAGLRNLQTAISLYRGDYLAEALYDPWTIEERERLLARYLATATVTADRLATRGDYDQAIQLCELVLQRDHCYEEAYQVLMQTHARAGSRSLALRSYARCVRSLHDELEIEPLPETTKLYEQIKRNQFR